MSRKPTTIESWNGLQLYTPDAPEAPGDGRYRFSQFLSSYGRVSNTRANGDEMYAARLAQRLRHELHTDPVSFCMALSYLPGAGYILHVNMHWFKRCPLWEVSIVLQHEIRHLTMRDVPRMRRQLRNVAPEERSMYASMVCNPAADCAVNTQLVINNPEMRTKMTNSPPIMPEDYELEEGRSSEWYVDQLDALYNESKACAQDVLSSIRTALSAAKGRKPDDPIEDKDGTCAEEAEGAEPGEGQGEGQGEGSPSESTGQGTGQASGRPDANQRALTASMLVAEAHKAISENANLSAGAKRMLHQGLDHALRRAHLEEPENVSPSAESQSADAVRDMLEESSIRNLEVSVLTDLEKIFKQVGRMPAHLQSRLEELRETRVIPWEKVLKQHVQARIRTLTRSTQRLPSRRRFGTQGAAHGVPNVAELYPAFPGKTKDRRHSVLFCVDTSGSMGNDEVMAGMNEVYSMLKSMPGVEMYVAQMDTQISSLGRVTDAEDFKNYLKKIGRTSRGGTDCDALMDLVDATWSKKDYPELADHIREVALKMPKIDACVYFTDGYVPQPKERPKSRAQGVWLWCVTSNGARIPDNWPGVKLRMTPPVK